MIMQDRKQLEYRGLWTFTYDRANRLKSYTNSQSGGSRGNVWYDSKGSNDHFLSKYSFDGTYQWALTWGGSGNDILRDLDVNLGYGVKPEYQGKGFATEASNELIRHAFEDLGFNRIVGIAEAGNRSSIKVMEKLGMKFEGVHREEYRHGDIFPDFAHYAILKDEWVK